MLKDALQLKSAGLKAKAESLIKILRENPFRNPAPYEKLLGDLSSANSRRINQQHRLVCQVHADEKIVRILRMWTHYE